MKIKKGDKVKVISGKDKGKTGTVVRAFPAMDKVVVEGIAMAKRHTRPIGNQSGRIIERERRIHVSNVAKVTK
jgi:large subunit ribosomal protein L24